MEPVIAPGSGNRCVPVRCARWNENDRTRLDGKRSVTDTKLHVIVEADPNRFVKAIWSVNRKTIRFASTRTEGSDFNLWD